MPGSGKKTLTADHELMTLLPGPAKNMEGSMNAEGVDIKNSPNSPNSSAKNPVSNPVSPDDIMVDAKSAHSASSSNKKGGSPLGGNGGDVQKPSSPGNPGNLTVATQLEQHHLLLEELSKTLNAHPSTVGGKANRLRRYPNEVPWSDTWDDSSSCLSNWNKRVMFLIKLRLKMAAPTVFYAITCGVIYIIGSNIGAKAHMEWMSKREYDGPGITGTLDSNTGKEIPDPRFESNSGHYMRLPDMVLDHLDEPDVKDGWMTFVADNFAFFFFIAGAIYNFLNDHWVYLVLSGNVCALHWLFNFFTENSTVLPTSFGYERCLKNRYAPHELSHGDKHFFYLNPTGSCAAMMWSGHTFNICMGLHFWMLGLRHRYPSLDQPIFCGKTGCFGGSSAHSPTVWKGWLTKRFAIMFCLASFEITLLLLDFSHYTVDIIIALLIIWLLLSSDRAQFAFYYWNWRTGSVPFEDNLYYQRLRLKKVLFLAKKGGLSAAIGDGKEGVVEGAVEAGEGGDWWKRVV